MNEILLDVRGLTVTFRTAGSSVMILDDLSFSVGLGEILGFAGESGSGKTMAAMALMGLLPHGAIPTGSVIFDGEELLTGRRIGRARGREIAMVFQDPTASLHPMLTIEYQLTEHVRHHLRFDQAQARQRAIDLLEDVRIPAPAKTLASFPHQLSGGMRQRVAIAMALACHPKLLIADEPTTALDVTVQAGILRLLDDVRRDRMLSILMISHDLAVLSALADKVAVIYSGRLAELGPIADVLIRPRHPYTQALLKSLPRGIEAVDSPLVAIAGSAPAPSRRPSGCAFHPRCAYALEACTQSVPVAVDVDGRRRLACPPDPLAVHDE